MIIVSCDLCGSASAREVGLGRRFGIPAHVVACMQCGLVYQNPRMAESELAAFYRDRYRDVYSGNNTEPPADFVARQVAHGQEVLNRMRSVLPERATILDVGCGPGGMLLPFHEGGFNAVGLEPGPYALWGREQLGIDVRTAAFENADLTGIAPAAVLLSFVLEHVASPRSVLRRAHDVLQPDGLVYVEVPNLSAIRGPLSKYFHVAHLTYFTPATLVALLRTCGFREMSVLDDHPYSLAVVARWTEPMQVVMPAENPRLVIARIRRHGRIAGTQELVKTLLRPVGTAAGAATRIVAGPDAERRLHARARQLWARARYGD